MQELAQSFSQHPWAWLAVAALGAYHGVNPGMGWLFAVSNGMQSRRSSAVFSALPPIALGHLLAMMVALLPFVVLGWYLQRVGGIRAAAALLLLAFGVYKLLSSRHPRILARVGPTHLVAWSFLAATAHGAGLMLVPVVLSMTRDASGTMRGHGALHEVMSGGLGLTLLAGMMHALAMVVAAGAIGWVVYRYVGVGFLRRGWINLDLLWGVMLIVVGAVALLVALRELSRGLLA